MKFAYGLSLPFNQNRICGLGEPKRGDVIVFLFPRDESLHYIKRVIGVPGDNIEFRKGLICKWPESRKGCSYGPGVIKKVLGEEDSLSGELFLEKLGASTHYVKYSSGVSYYFSRNFEVNKIPANKFFVVGDNRDDSYDSRNWGLVDWENIKGKAKLIWLSADLEQGAGRANKIRWERSGMIIR